MPVKQLASTHFVGKAGQFAVMAQLSLRGYNVAIPEIDIGDDVFVLNDISGRLYRIQVKTARAKALTRKDHKNAYRCQFSVNVDHVGDEAMGGSHYVFVASCDIKWRFIVIERSILRHLIAVDDYGSDAGNGKRMLSVVFFGPNSAKSSTLRDAIDLSKYAGNWQSWPTLL